MEVYDVSSHAVQLNRFESVKRNIHREDAKLYEACQDFEAIFIKQMLNSMKKTVNKTGFINGGMAEEIFEDMLYDEYAVLIAKNARLGLADMVYKQLSKSGNI